MGQLAVAPVELRSEEEQLDVRLFLDGLVAQQAPQARADWLIEDLERLFAQLFEAAAAGRAAQLDWLEQLARWLRARRSGFGGGAPGSLSSARLRLLIEALRSLPAELAALQQLVRGVAAQTCGLRLLAEVGLPVEQGFLREAADRLVGKRLPRPRNDGDLAELVERLFPSAADAAWLEEAAPELVHAVVALFAPDGLSLEQAMLQALALLAARASALGLAEDVRARGSERALANNPFLALPHGVDALAAACREGPRHAALGGLSCRAAIGRCRVELAAVHQHLEERGVSTDLVWRIERAGKTLDRMAAIIRVLAPARGAGVERAATGAQFLASLVRDRIGERSLRALCRASLQKLLLKTIERNGSSGAHYITATREAWHQMVSSAAGGGLLTAGTVALKLAIVSAALPVFFEGAFSSLNYAASFVAMQLFGFTLATKQPAMTAAALAAVIRPAADGSAGKRPLDPAGLVELAARITRSQLAAIAGNIGMVVIAALALDGSWRLLVGHAFLDASGAHHVLESLHPTRSGTACFAALTGLFLWLGSLGAGLLENWVVYRRLPEAVADSRRLQRLFGRERARRLGAAIARHAGGVGSSVALGVLLGMAPALGRFIGAPLEVRHVTLSTGSLALAGSALGATHLGAAFGDAVLGILAIALFNFGVSFVLALAVALRAREATSQDRRAFAKLLLRKLFTQPLGFLLPPPGEGAGKAD